MAQKIKALALLSGGLDSTLAVRVIHDQGIDIQAIHFSTGFCVTDAAAKVRRPDEAETMQGGPGDAFSAAETLGVPVKLVNVSDGYLDVLHNPKHGYGKNVNPCVDCRVYMFAIAKWLMQEFEAQFVFTGEVLGQRPKSQHLPQLLQVAKESGLGDRLLRPLSARLLPETLPEREGWVDRNRLYDFHGRSRKPQMELASRFGITSYPQPAGGCCHLTDPNYARKVQDVWTHREKQRMTWDDYLLLKVGRHLRVGDDLKVVVGRNERENNFLDYYKSGRIRLEVEGVPGPVALLEESTDAEAVLTAARVAARYSDAGEDDDVTVLVKNGSDDYRVRVKPFKPEEVKAWVIK